jgi:Tol biopolymer transport system component
MRKSISKSLLILIGYMMIGLNTSYGQLQNKAQMLAPGIISTGRDYCTTITPDGKTLYFVRVMSEDKDVIHESYFSKGQWTEPKPVSFTSVYSDTDPLLSPDGSRLFFMTTRPTEGSEPKEDYDIWVVGRRSNGWEEPTPISPLINTDYYEGFPSTSNKGTLYFFRANEPGFTEQDIWFSRYSDGKYQTPVRLGPHINTEYWDGHPLISPDEAYLVFYSQKPGGYGSCDLYVSHNENGEWSEPHNLGPSVNTDVCEMVPFISADKKYLYFTRVDKERNSKNIFYISLEGLITLQ